MPYQEIPFVNMGILVGQSKTGPRGEQLTIDSIYNQLPSSEYLYHRFVFYNKTLIEQATNNGLYNMFIPIEKGGLGCLPFDFNAVKTTLFQRQLATYNENLMKQYLKLGKFHKGTPKFLTPTLEPLHRAKLPASLNKHFQILKGEEKSILRPKESYYGEFFDTMETIDPSARCSIYRYPNLNKFREFKPKVLVNNFKVFNRKYRVVQSSIEPTPIYNPTTRSLALFEVGLDIAAKNHSRDLHSRYLVLQLMAKRLNLSLSDLKVSRAPMS
jgi:hypothetical protein